MAVAEARVHPDPDTMALLAAAELLEHLGRARVHRQVELEHAVEGRRVDHVGGVDEARRVAAAVVAGPDRPLHLAERDRVDQAALLAKESQHVQVRAGLLREADHVEGLQRGHPLAHHVGVVEIIRGAMLAGDARHERGIDRLHGGSCPAGKSIGVKLHRPWPPSAPCSSPIAARSRCA